MKKIITAYLTLQPIEQKSLFSLGFLLICQVIFLSGWGKFHAKQKFPIQFTVLSDSIESLENLQYKMHSFNPNQVDSLFWDSIGLETDVIQDIMNAKDTGMVFKSAYDLLAIPTFPFALYKKIKHFVHINAFPEYESKPYDKTNNASFPKSKNWIDINQADSSKFTCLPGVGAGRARLIIKYRNALGGFVDKYQLLEVFSLHDSVFRRFENEIYVAKQDSLQTINLNTVEETSLWKHPYLRIYAKQIVRFRQSGRKLNSFDDFLSICSPTPDSIHTYRLKKYLFFKF